MKSTKRLMTTGIALTVLVLMGTAAKADTVSFSLDQPYQSINAGTLLFGATITNNGAGTLYLNGDTLVVDSPLSGDDTPFFFNFPLSLSSGNSAKGELFTIAVTGGTPSGLYAGSFTLLGGGDPSAQNQLGLVPFSVNVASVNPAPEPSTFLLVGSGLLGFAGVVRQRLLS